MKLKLMLGLLLLVLISGCTTVYYVAVDVVEHNGDLEIALEECKDICGKYNHPTPRLNQCDDDQCVCEC